MEAEETPSILVEALQDMPPVPESLVNIWRGLGSATIEAEEGRLRERFLDLASRLVAINQLKGKENELTLFT